MRRLPLLAVALLLAACDSAPAPFSTVDLDPAALPTPIVAGEPFRVVVSGESEPAPAVVRFSVYRGDNSANTNPTGTRLLAVVVPVSEGGRVEGEVTATIPASSVRREETVALQVALFDADNTMLSAKSREWPVVPAP